MTPATAIEMYIKLRRKMTDIEAKHKKELAPYYEARENLENWLLDHLNQTGLDSTKCPAGTAFRATSTSVTVKDWPKTLAYIQEHKAWDLLEARVAKTPVVEVVSETGNNIPGVEISQASVLRVRAG